MSTPARSMSWTASRVASSCASSRCASGTAPELAGAHARRQPRRRAAPGRSASRAAGSSRRRWSRASLARRNRSARRDTPPMLDATGERRAVPGAARGRAVRDPEPVGRGVGASVLEALGFQALATTSSGFAFTLGRLDGGATLDEVVAHVRALADATDLPVSVDLENGYGPGARGRRGGRSRASPAAGAVGGSIEDYDPAGRSTSSTTPSSASPPRSRRRARLDFPFTLTARAENHIRGNPDLDDTIARLQAYERGRRRRPLRARACAPSRRSAPCATRCREPVNVLARPGLTVAEIVEAGAQRISVGGALTWVAVGAMVVGGRGDARSRRLLGVRLAAAARRLAWSTKKFCHQLSRSSSGGRTFAEPISLSSTDPADFRLPATASAIGFDLVASRTRRTRETRGRVGPLQGPPKRTCRNLRGGISRSGQGRTPALRCD